LELGPKAVAHHTSIVNGDNMFLIGGSNTKSENKGFFKLSMRDMSWELVEQLQNSRVVSSSYKDKGSKVLTRDGHSSCFSQEFKQMYIFGGFIAGERTNQLIVYSFKGPAWARVKTTGPSPSARNGHSACLYNGFMYIFGGRNNDNKKLNDLWKYDILKQEWTEISMINKDEDPTWCVPVERSGHSCDIYGQYMVVFGGFYDLTKELNDLYLFDFVTERWIAIFVEENSPVAKSILPYNDT
jgi:N-acetylneuraminic acid mutarotase